MKIINDGQNAPKPFLKWAGGKTQLLDVIDSHLPQDIKESGVIEKYFEPFVGGGAVFFYLIHNYEIKYVYLGDINKDLMLTYNMVKNRPEELIDILKSLKESYLLKEDSQRKEFFYDLRSKFNEKSNMDINLKSSYEKQLVRASQLIFLNKTCFNGLYRVNLNGEFNVPFANPKNPLIYDETNILNVSNSLRDVNLYQRDYKRSKKFIDDKSLVYLDPPYKPLNGKNSFEGYSKFDFNDKDQKNLAKYYREIDKKGASVLLNNSDLKNVDESDNFFDDLYGEFNIERVYAKRSINSNGKKRGKITEILVSNF